MIAAAMTAIAAACTSGPGGNADREMDRFISGLMDRMTVEEKIGQLNLPTAGEITTGEARSSTDADRIRRGEIGGLFNIKGYEKIREIQFRCFSEWMSCTVMRQYSPYLSDFHAAGIWMPWRNPPG